MRGRKQCDPINGCGKFYNQKLNKCPSCNTPETFSNFIPYNPHDWVYDLETFPNIFTAAFKHPATGTHKLFEISDRVNDANKLYAFLNVLKGADCRMIGFNNLGFDYPIIHFFITNYRLNPGVSDLYNKAMQIINTPWQHRFSNVIWDNDILISQIDLFKIHHFDNDARRTSLKMLEFNMQSDNVEELPYEPGTVLNNTKKDVLIKYNNHDVDETEKFYFKSLEHIEFREQLSIKYNRNYLNHNDTKIGKDSFIVELEKALPGSCYGRDEKNRKVTRQTIRTSINLGDVIFPYIKFKEPEFERMRAWLASQVITETKGVFVNLSVTVRDFKYVFGVGGIHGSIESSIVESDDEYVLYDWDVASFYPNIGVKNKLYPEHLSETFCKIYEETFEQRRGYKKGTPENAALKLALNGVYGDSNNKYSPFYDPQYTMSITINGQLLLCMLAQYLIDIPNLKMIQINTDGLTVLCPRNRVDEMNAICKWWQEYTCLELEHVIYSRMFIRDVNNYIAEYTDGSVKRKGAYEYKLEWHQNFSSLVVPKAAEAALVHGKDITDFILNHENNFDFMLRSKVSGKDKLVFKNEFDDERRLQKITRYYISNSATAGALTKIAPPANNQNVGAWKRATKLTDIFYHAVIAELRAMNHDNRLPHELDVNGLPWNERINTKNRSKYETRRTGLNVGYIVTPCNNMKDFNREEINFNYYIEETKKLIDPLIWAKVQKSKN